MAYQNMPAKPDQGGTWTTWGDSADANLREVISDVPSLKTDIANLKAAPPAAVVVTHGSNPDVPRPAGAQLVIWEGTVAPNQAAGTDFWRVP